MPLSEHEEKLLAQLEAQLNAEDPQFARNLGGSGEKPTPSVSLRRMVLGLVVAVLGLGGVLAGVATQLIVLGVLGFVVMGLGVVLALPRRERRAPDAWGHEPHAESRPRKQSSPLMQRLEQRWDERRDQNGLR